MDERPPAIRIGTDTETTKEGHTTGQFGNTWCTCRKYQFMELNLQKRMAGLKDKIPDIQKTLDSVQFLKLRQVGVPSRRATR